MFSPGIVDNVFRGIAEKKIYNIKSKYLKIQYTGLNEIF